MDLVRRRTMSSLGLTFRNFKCKMYTQFDQKVQTPHSNVYPTLKPLWKALTEYMHLEEKKDK
jgi:hypothetical protein